MNAPIEPTGTATWSNSPFMVVSPPPSKSMTALEVIAQIQLAIRRADTSDEAMANKLAADALEQFVGEFIEERITKALDRLGMADI